MHAWHFLHTCSNAYYAKTVRKVYADTAFPKGRASALNGRSARGSTAPAPLRFAQIRCAWAGGDTPPAGGDTRFIPGEARGRGAEAGVQRLNETHEHTGHQTELKIPTNIYEPGNAFRFPVRRMHRSFLYFLRFVSFTSFTYFWLLCLLFLLCLFCLL